MSLPVLAQKTLQEASSWDFAAGVVVLVDKPLGWTSFQVVHKLRRILGLKKIGHAGTLDPLATGLLICCTGKATKSIDGIQAQEKAYEAKIRLGATTASADREFPPRNLKPYAGLSSQAVENSIQALTGDIIQYPPVFSAVKIKGKRAYELARKGKDIEMKPRSVRIYAADIQPSELPLVAVNIRCSKGTYIRSWATDLGSQLGVGGYLWGLRRTAIGAYSIAEAVTIPQLMHAFK